MKLLFLTIIIGLFLLPTAGFGEDDYDDIPEASESEDKKTKRKKPRSFHYKKKKRRKKKWSRFKEKGSKNRFLDMSRISFYGGSLTEFYNSMQTDAAGSTNKFKFTPFFAFAADFYLTKSLFLVPEIGLTLPKSEEDDAISTLIIMPRIDLAYQLKLFRFKLGTTYYMTRISGQGGSVELNNGSGFDTFYLPEQTNIAYNHTLDLGVESFIPFEDNISASIKLQAMVFRLLDSESRKTSYTISFGIHFSPDEAGDFF